MKTINSILLPLGSALLLTACGEAAKNDPATEAAATTPMANMSVTTVSGRGTGTVTAIDMAAGKVTLDHAPIPETNWPAMTMGFEAAPEMLEKIAVGDKVAFEMTMSGDDARVTSIRPQ